jgi:hypothetical protein
VTDDELEQQWSWLRYGYERGWCSPPVCANHDGVPTSDEEAEDWDACVSVVRLYSSVEERLATETDHAPSRWRASNAGLARP